MAKYIKGLNKDAAPIDQPEGSYRYAKNVLANETSGAISNEPGNKSRGEIDEGYTVIGTIETTDDRVVIFATDGQDEHKIYLHDAKTNTTTAILHTFPGNSPADVDFDLKFSISFPIEGTYKIDPDGNLLVYWTDNVNPPRSLNVTRQEGVIPNNRIYGVNPNTTPNKNYVDRLNLFPHAGPVPSINFTKIAEGGALKTGTYYLFLAYVDEDFTQTNYVSYSLGVPIVEDVESVLPIERYDGAVADSQTGKSIVWTATNLNTDYEYLRPVVVARVDGVEKAYRLNDLDITTGTRTIVFSLLEGYEEGSVEETIVDTVAYDTAKTLTQLDGVLYLGNLTGSRDIGYQKHANFIKLSTVTRELDPFDPYELDDDNLMFGYLNGNPLVASKEQGYRSINNLSGADNIKGYMRDEVYAFYIAFVLNDGSMSYAYHIPGREALENERAAGNIDKKGNNATLPASLLETAVITQGIDPDINEMTQGAGKAFHFYDFSQQSPNDTNFWENLNESYPNTSDYDVFDGLANIGSIRGTNVRHHRMPTNANVERASIIDSNDTFTPSTDSQTITYFYASGFVNQGESGGQDNIAVQDAGGGNMLITDDEAIDQVFNMQAPDASGILGDIQDTYGNSNSWVFNDSPNNGQFGYYVWANGDNGGIFGSASGGGNATVVDSGPEGVTINPSADSDSPNLGNDNAIIYAIFVWQETTDAVNQAGFVSQTVQALGVKLSDIKIPKTIADKVQGFRIYYAERDHTNRRVLGQDIIKNTTEINDIDLGGCDGEGGSGASEDFLLSPGTLFYTPEDGPGAREVTFHDFYLLNGGYKGDDGKGKRKSLVPATHTTYEYRVGFYSFRGPGHNYESVDDDACQDDSSYASFHIANSYFSEFFLPDAFVHFPIREKCKTYLNGDSIFDGRGIGFGKRVYNLGGESSILLGYKPTRAPRFLGPWTDAPGGASWHELVGPGAGFSYSPGQQGQENTQLQVHNLQAFKTDMYLSYDTQDLIWTGFEVLGEDLANYTLEEDGTSTIGATHATGDIYGGDTFICRHGYRITHRPEYANVTPHDRKALFYVICESTDNINFRHEVDVDSSYFPGSPAKKMLDARADVDFTDVDNIRYNKDYSLGVADIKPAIPYPLRESDPTVFKTRVQRSAKADNTSLIDNYRVHLALQFKDLPRNRGDLTKLATLNNLLYLHTEDSLFRTKGKDTLQLSDGSEAFVGGGDIFAQEPDEVIQTRYGYGGTQSQWVSIVTKHGYFSLDYRNRRVFLFKDQLYDISKQGLESWFQDNIPFALEPYGLASEEFDNPVEGIGFHSMYDERYDRFILTKRDLKPTKSFTTKFNRALGDKIEWDDLKKQFVLTVDDNGTAIVTILSFDDEEYFERTGWTVSYDVELNVWVSFHDYVPYKYTRSKDVLASFEDGNKNIWVHDDESNRGSFYGVDYASEFEFIYNSSKDLNKVVYSFEYTVDVFDTSNSLIHDPAFSSFYVYNTHQISDEQPVEYMINTRRVGNEWKINKFRDLALLVNSTSAEYIGPFTGSNFGVPGASVAGTNISSVETTSAANMFTIDGMSETINAAFINATKSWNKQRKFVDKWVGIRLKYDNITKKLINLYSTDVAAKKFYR